jgi:hypothetical protein
MIRFAPRASPLRVAGVHASGDAAITLARLLTKRPDAARQLAAVSSGDAIVVIGTASALPWIDGAVWLGREPEAPELLVPTHLGLFVHPALVLAALRKQHPAVALPVALVPAGTGIAVFPLGHARAPGGAPLDAFLASTT